MKILLAKDLMKHDVSYVRADTSLVDLAAFLDEEGIHGAPVVDSLGNLVGVVSRTDLVRAVNEGSTPETGSSWFRMLNDEGEFEDLTTDLDVEEFPGSEVTVSEIMSSTVVTVEEDWTAAQVATLMRKNGVHRVLVLNSGRVTGILSATDLLQAVEQYEPKR